MININEHFMELQESYLFSTIAKKIKEFQEKNPKVNIIKMGIGDVTKPLCPSVIAAMKEAVEELGCKETFRGYGPEQGYSFLKEAIAKEDYQARGIQIDQDEIFISDGAKCDTGNIGDILDTSNKVAITDPVYPVYLDSNVMAGRAGNYNKQTEKYEKIVYMPVKEENDFVPELPSTKVDMIYLCFPNNPTGTVLTKQQLKKWVQYAKENQSIILYDSAYEAYITERHIPHSIYEIEGAKEVAIEFRSFSKTAGFTGVRCGYTVVPKQVVGYTKAGEAVSLHKLWNRRQCTKFNGASYIAQRGAAAIYTKEGKKEVKEMVQGYLENAKILKTGLEECGFTVYGGINAPYVWLKVPKGKTSWDFFDELLQKVNIVGTPGSGFGPSGEGYFRFSAFATTKQTKQAVERLKQL